MFKKDYKYDIKYQWIDVKLNIEFYYEWKIKPTIHKLKILFQKSTPWLKYQRWLLNQASQNYCKLLNKSMTCLYERTRDCEETLYFRTVAKFGYVRFYEEKYVSKQSGKAINAFLNIFVPSLCGNEINDYEYKRKCLVRGFCLTKNQAIKLIKKIKCNTPSITWNNLYNNQYDYGFLKFLINESKNNNEDFEFLKKYCQDNIIEKFEKSGNENVSLFVANLKCVINTNKDRESVIGALSYLINHLDNLEYEFDKNDYIVK